MDTNTAQTYRITTDILLAVTDARALTAAALRRYDETADRIGVPVRSREEIEQNPVDALLFLLDPSHGLIGVPGAVAVSTGGVVALAGL
ncbi:MAG TPA: hypothetical protein VGR06_10655 [Actinophytocola sp.]|jgi:hypothetical protein|uniref:hypothetical protein n=1 Tax=Actinophytocola sp. TaxID=1872138 RepID=UPI002DFA52B7|nr:hypothetical protein [Actinophytocola sp.]